MGENYLLGKRELQSASNKRCTFSSTGGGQGYAARRSGYQKMEKYPNFRVRVYFTATSASPTYKVAVGELGVGKYVARSPTSPDDG